MFEVLLAGTFPAGTLERMQAMVKGTDINIRAVVTEEEFAKENDVDAIVLRILKMPRPVIERFSSRLKMIMRWGVGYDAVDVAAAREKERGRLQYAGGQCLCGQRTGSDTDAGGGPEIDLP